MKKALQLLVMNRMLPAVLFGLVLCSGNILAQEWTIYDASVLPSEMTPNFVTSSGSFSENENAIMDDPAIEGNKLLWMDVSGNPNNAFYWRMNFLSHEIELNELTVIMRVKGHDNRDMAMDLDMDFGGKRSRVTLHRETQLARIRNGSGTNAELDIDLTEWHMYRFTMTETETRLYIDEDTEPVLVFTPASGSNRHFRFGDGDSGNTLGADIDWVIWDVSGAYAPGEGLDIPAELLPGESNWTVYNGSVLPNEFSPAFMTASGSLYESENAIINDPDTPGNKLLWMDINGNPQSAFLWRMNFANHDITVDDLTIVMRIKGNPDRDMALDLDMHYNDIRSRLTFYGEYNSESNFARIRNGTGDNATLPVNVTEWNTYRFAMNADQTRVYVNEGAEPVMVFTPAAAVSGNRHFRFGDGDSGASFGAEIDWMIWDVSGSFAPGEGSPLPDFSYTPGSDASLAQLNVDGNLIEGFDPDVYEYELILPTGTSLIPEISALAADATATLQITQAEAIPGTATVEVTAENGFTIRTYTVDIRLISTDASLQEIMIDDALLEDFDPEVYAYTINLPLETTEEIPVVGATANDEKAVVVITQSAELDGEATIVVTAEDGTTEQTYTLNFVLVSIDASLSDLLLDGVTIEGFDPAETEYSILFSSATTEVPIVTAVPNNEHASVVITQAEAIPGEATVVVTAEDGETEWTYTIYFLVGSDDATLANLLVDGATIEGFSPEVIDYYLVLPAGTVEIPVISAVANDEDATLVITQATELPGLATVLVTADDQFTQLLYTVHIRTTSTDASLQDLMLNGNSLPVFDPEVLTYSIRMPEGSVVVPVVSAIASDEGATVEMTPAAQIPGASLVVVTAEDNETTATYTLNLVEAGYNWLYYDASVLPGDHVPQFSQSNVGGTGGTNEIIVDPSDESNSFLELITAANGDNFMWVTPLQEGTPAITLVMKVKAANDVSRRVVELDLHHNGIRERLYINREENRVRLNEAIGGGDGGEIPAPDGVDLSEWNIYRLTKDGNTINLYLNEHPEPIASGNTNTSSTQQYFRFGDGNSSHNAAVLMDWIVWDETGAYAPGEGLFIPAKVITPNWDATLTDLKAGGTTIEGFDPEVTEYELLLPAGTTAVPQITATLSDEKAVMVITQADALPGEASVDVTAENGFTGLLYTISMRVLSNNANLADLQFNGNTVQNFDPATTAYSVILAAGTTQVPEVTAETADTLASVDITQAAALPGEATVLVTAEDGTTKTYTIDFSLDDTGIHVPDAERLRIFPNPASSMVYLEWNRKDASALIQVFNTSGQLMISKELFSQAEALDISQLLPGVYVIQLTAGREQLREMLIKR